MRLAILNAILILALGACAGGAGQMNNINGVAPEDGSCSVNVLDHDTDRILSSTVVRGNFAIGFGLGDSFPPKVNVAGVCNGKRVVYLPGVIPGGIGSTNLGVLSP
jgi:hypothetical protein